MDNIVSEAQDTMINQLNFGLPETSQYITDRRFVNYFPSGSNIYSASGGGNKNIRFYISGDSNQYLDLSSIRLFANIKNTDVSDRAKFLRPLGGLHAFMERYRATVGGQIVQDIDQYARHCQLYKSFKSKDVNEMDDIESSANPSFDDDYHRYANGLNNFLDYDSVVSTGGTATQGKTNGAGTDADPRGVVNVNLAADHNETGKIGFRHTRHSLSGIPSNGQMRLGHKPVCGLLESNYYLPLRFAPLELEFTIVSDSLEPIVEPKGNATSNPTTETDKQGYYFQEGNTSVLWEINNVIIRAEVITLDNTVDNIITKHLLEGQSLKLIVPQYHTLTQTFNAGGGEINMNIVKSASKLSNAFITLYREKKTGKRYGQFLPDNYVYKRWNYFYNPMINSEINDGFDIENNTAINGQGFQDFTRNLSWQMQVGNEKFPEFECQSLSEAFYFLRRTIHYHNADQNSLNISYKQYRENKFIIGVSFEKMADVNFTSINTKMGSLLTFKIKGTEGSLAPAEQIQEIFTHLVSESVLELRESGAVVYD